ncbi:MAG: hypothetical protein DIU79_01095 [Actinobacteria bacterium]|nr:MAG: hypothetical protein DIU79_01095 [Actinomycetota bacterium]
MDASDYLDAVLLDEPSTADLRSKVTVAWQEFARDLSASLRRLPVGAQVEVTLDPTATGTGTAVYSVSLHHAEQDQITALAVSNAGLPPEHRMDRAAIADLVALGWAPPGVLEGSADCFGMRTTVDDANRLAATVTRTLRDVYGAPHPAFLVYLAHRDGEPIPMDPIGSARPEPVWTDQPELGLLRASERSLGEEERPLEERVRAVVAAMMRSAPDQLHVDADGDIGIRAGSAMVFVRVRDNPPLVDVFSPVLTEVRPTERLYARLSELTNRMPLGRLYCTDDTVWASIPVFGRNFQPVHLVLAIQVMTGLADELDDRLHGEFGGRRFFGDDKSLGAEGRSAPSDGEHRTGMYL